jgi:hypothetical protein
VLHETDYGDSLLRGVWLGDGRQTWCDFAHTQVPGASGGFDYYSLVSLNNAGSTSISPILDGTLAAGILVNGPLGDRIRVKYKVTSGGATGSYSFQTLALVD